MISPRHLGLLIRHLDCIDRVVGSRMDTARPWHETALTSQLCDLLDDETCDREKLDYTRQQLREDLESSGEALTVTLRVETIQYLPHQERFVTQSDVGLVIRYRDRLSSVYWDIAWLLQAKRAIPALRRRPAFHADSRFELDNKQHERLLDLNAIVGVPFTWYALYGPRPQSLARQDCAALIQARNQAVGNHIYDFDVGQLLFKEMHEGTGTLDASVLVAEPHNVPHTLRQAHSLIACRIWPLSWFITLHFMGRDGRTPIGRRPGRVGNRADEMSDEECRAHDIVLGDRGAVEELIERGTARTEVDRLVPFLPAQTMIVEVSPGGALREVQD